MKKPVFVVVVVILNVMFWYLIIANKKNNASIDDKSSTSMDYDYGGMNPEAPKQTKEFGQFAGLWDCISEDLVMNEDGTKSWYTNKAFWKWEFILGGHAVMNRWWQEDNSPNPLTKEYFASGVFIFNPKTNLWEAVIMNSRPHNLSPKFQAAYNEGEIVMHDGTGKWQVTFFDIKENSFEWKYEVLTENKVWSSISRISATRKI